MKVEFKMTENGKCNKNNAAIENNTELITKANSIKHGWFQTINNAVCYYKTPFNVAMILEQVSNCNNFLREQVSMEIAAKRRQNNMSSEEKLLQQE